MNNDLISRSARLADLREKEFLPVIGRRTIERAPTVDAVPVVRCRECKHYEIHKPKVLENCERNGYIIPMKPDDFCSYGERKKVTSDAASLSDEETAETVHSLSGWAYKSNSQEQRATV